MLEKWFKKDTNKIHHDTHLYSMVSQNDNRWGGPKSITDSEYKEVIVENNSFG